MHRNTLAVLVFLISTVSCISISNSTVQTAMPKIAIATPIITETATPTSTTAPALTAPSLQSSAPGSTITPIARFGKTEWKPGLPNGIPNVPVAANVREFGAKGDGKTDDSGAFIEAIRSVNAGAVLIPAGTYLLQSPLEIGKSIVLRGEGADKTHLVFDLAGQNKDAITIAQYLRGDWVNVIGGYTRGSTTLTLANASSFRSGMFAEIQQANDASVMYTDPTWIQDWSENSIGQIVRVISVSGNTVTLEEPLYNDYKPNLNPQIRTLGLVEYAGVERLHVKRLDKDDNHIFYFKYVAFSWLREVESEDAFRSHIVVDSSYGCEIRDSYFHHAHDYGGGGHGYGVSLLRHTTNCLVENNIFAHLRHSMIIEVGAVGNVYGYNYSRDPVSDEGPLADISVHGHYPSYNLFEGNVVQEIGISDYWGPVGPGNVYFRNRVETGNIFVKDSSHSQIIIGNELVRGTISIDKTVNDTIVNGNYINGRIVLNGRIVWNLTNTEKILPASQYYLAKPPFYGSLRWPSLGADLPGGTNPALERYRAGNYIPSP
jgi:hypothetical protein